MASFRLTLFPERVTKEVNSPGGSTSRAVQETCREIIGAARPLIGKKYSGHHAGRGRSLADSGDVQHNQGASWSAVFDHPIATMHHNGSSAHTFPRKQSGFYVRRGPGGYRFGPRRGPISHPGHDGNPYLVDAARKVGARASGGLRRGTAGPFPIFRARG